VPFPQLVDGDFGQLRDAPDVSQFVTGEVAKLVLDGSDSFFEPDSRDWVPISVDGRNADRNYRFLLGVGQLFIVERDDDKSHTSLSGGAKASSSVSRILPAISLLIEEMASTFG
jgi:hypothetical protein